MPDTDHWTWVHSPSSNPAEAPTFDSKINQYCEKRDWKASKRIQKETIYRTNANTNLVWLMQIALVGA